MDEFHPFSYILDYIHSLLLAFHSSPTSIFHALKKFKIVLMEVLWMVALKEASMKTSLKLGFQTNINMGMPTH
jgi:hypothetical protein